MLPPPTPPPPTLKPKNRWKPALAFLVVFLGFGVYSKINPPTTSSTPSANVATHSGGSTSDWLIAHADAIQSYLSQAKAHALSISDSTTPAEMMSNCQNMLTSVDAMYFASWKTDSGAPESWIAELQYMHDAMSACTRSDFTTAGDQMDLARGQMTAFTHVIQANTP